MKPEDVPDELAKPTAEVLQRHYELEFDASHLTWKDFAHEARDLLAAVLPLRDAQTEREVRAKVAAELLEQGNKIPLGSGFRRGLRAAAQFANPPSVEDAARAVQDAYGRHERGDS